MHVIGDTMRTIRTSQKMFWADEISLCTYRNLRYRTKLFAACSINAIMQHFRPLFSLDAILRSTKRSPQGDSTPHEMLKGVGASGKSA
jgi:hypothetical protein